jgi:hypothetical protein
MFSDMLAAPNDSEVTDVSKGLSAFIFGIKLFLANLTTEDDIFYMRPLF